MDYRVLIHSGKVLITDKKIKYIEKAEQLQQIESKNEWTTTTSATTNHKINNINRQKKFNIKQINR